jgi:tetratricopeptide (TPR) repeat protein
MLQYKNILCINFIVLYIIFQFYFLQPLFAKTDIFDINNSVKKTLIAKKRKINKTYSEKVKEWKNKLKIAKKNQNKEDILNALNELIDSYYNLGQYKKALLMCQQCEQYLKKFKVNKFYYIYMYKGVIYHSRYDLQNSLVNYFKALKVSQNFPKAPIYIGIAEIFIEIKNYNSALFYLDLAKENAKQINDIVLEVSVLDTLWINYFKQKEYKKALAVLEMQRKKYGNIISQSMSGYNLSLGATYLHLKDFWLTTIRIPH